MHQDEGGKEQSHYQVWNKKDQEGYLEGKLLVFRLTCEAAETHFGKTMKSKKTEIDTIPADLPWQLKST